MLAEKDLLPKKAVTKKIQPRVAAPEKVLLEEDWEIVVNMYCCFELQCPCPSLGEVSWPPYGLLRTDISGGGYPRHPLVNFCG